MPIILAALALLGAAVFWYLRMRNAANMAGNLIEAASDVRAAARRFGYRMRSREHPVDGIESPVVAAAGIAEAFMALDGLPTQGQRLGILQGLQKAYRVNLGDAEEAAILGRWLVSQCKGPDAAITRMVRKLRGMEGTGGLQPLMQVLDTAASADGASLGTHQKEALEDMARRFGL